MTELNLDDASREAFATYDKNRDKSLTSDELPASLQVAKKQIDANSDNRISPKELAARMQAWHDAGHAVCNVKCVVRKGGSPLSGAFVSFVPEGFLGTRFRRASGKTGEDGTVEILHSYPDRPNPEIREGVRVGFYRIEVTKPELYSETIPAEFNARSKLGQEVAVDAAGLENGVVTIELP